MATFTTAQAAQVRMYLGYPDLYRYQDPRLESILSGDQISDDAMTLLSGILVQLAANDALVYGVNGLPGITAKTAGVKKVEEIEFFQAQSTQDLNVIREQLCNRLSNILGVPFYGRSMGQGGYPGDTFSESGGLGNPGGGNMFGLG